MMPVNPSLGLRSSLNPHNFATNYLDWISFVLVHQSKAGRLEKTSTKSERTVGIVYRLKVDLKKDLNVSIIIA
ncbi:hypothetical protein [Candidatus Nitrososphaera evergladensis]|uniref:hypothetical protein n=1 Tax=Candidatus Nitrososphaera evergladensis TaxID=1459637 RepID=UPI0011E5B87E|nr:hypothetical protein [Candidatus Nitrososphaera evergladensis]